MNKKLAFLSAIIISSMVISSCAQHPTKNTSPEAVTNQMQAGEVMIPNDAIRFNNELSLPAENKEGNKKVTIQKVFFSALGQRCILVADVKANKSVLCEERHQIYKAYPALAM